MTTADTNPSYVLTEARVPSAYFDGWAEIARTSNSPEGDRILLQTFRTGSQGRSDAEFLVGRIQSGLYYASVAPECFQLAEPGERTVADVLRERESN